MRPDPVTPVADFRPLTGPAAAAIGGAVLLLPLLGAWLQDVPLADKFVFPPPLHVPVDYVPWSWWAGAAVLALLGFIIAPWFTFGGRMKRNGSAPVTSAPARVRLPGWGWAALTWTLVWWMLAWSRPAWLGGVERFTFFPLWLGFVVMMNALTSSRGGACWLLRAPGSFARLFLVSALFWWSFEWLNHFTRNWHYLGAEDFGPALYAVHASLCFSTVLPAVASTQEWLATFRGVGTRLAHGPAWTWLPAKPGGVALVALGVMSLVLAGVAPTAAYAALWIGPAALACGWAVLRKREGWWHQLARGDWRIAGTWALAALFCGVWWELWNYASLPKWIYTVPFVERWHVFEMPLLGYAGYLGFGLECWFIVAQTMGRRAGDAPSAARPATR